MMKLPIYLDYMATTPVDPIVVARMNDCLTIDGQFANPASVHEYGKQATMKVEEARAQVARLLHAAPREIIWTSGATEANNIALRGAAYARAANGRHIITSELEHKAVLDVCRALEKEGFRVTYLSASNNGIVSPEQIAAAIESDTVLVSIMHVNNEIGVINDIKAIGQITRERGIWFHVDAAQSAGKVPINLMEMPIDLMSFSAHKIYGPKGIGALFVRLRPRVRLTPVLFGGGQEQGLRPGTLATHQIVGMGEAFALASTLMTQEMRRITSLQQRLWNGIRHLPQIYLNGDITQRMAGNLNICFAGLSKEILKEKLSKLAISSGSACNAFKTDRSHVLHALGLTPNDIDLSKRLSIGRFTTEQEIDYAITHIIEMYKT